MSEPIAFGVTAWSLDAAGPDAIAEAAALGFTAIQIDSGARDGDLRLDDPLVRDRYRAASNDVGVDIVAVAAGDLNDLGLTSPAGSTNAERCRLSIRIAIEGAADLGAPLVFLPSFREGEIHDEDDLRHTAAHLAEACDIAAHHPVTIATETTLDVAGHLALLRAATRPRLGILLDTQNPFLWGHDVPAMVDGLWPHLVDQVHVKDGRSGRMGDAILGEGESGFVATAGRLVAHGFAGTLVSENDYRGERRAAASRDLDVLRAAFRSS